MTDDKNEFIALEYNKTYEKRNEKARQSFGYVTIVVSILAACSLLLANYNNIMSVLGESVLYLFFSGIAIFTNSIIVLALENTVRTYQIAGYLRFLEEIINNTILKKNIILWESYLENRSPLKRLSNSSITLIYAFVFFMFAAVPIYSFVNRVDTSHQLHLAIMICFLSVNAFEIATALYLVFDLSTTQKNYYEKSLKSYRSAIKFETKTRTKNQMHKKPDRFLYFIGRIFGAFFMMKSEKRIHKSVNVTEKAPIIVLGNHASNIDFMAVALAFPERRFNFIMSDYFLRNRFLRTLAKLLGIIPITQFASNPVTIKKIYKAVNSGCDIALFPSGLSSFSGESTYIPFSTAKLIKKLCITTVFANVSGAHIAFPKWNMRKTRKSLYDINVNYMLTEKQIKSMSLNEIYDTIVSRLYFDDYEWQKNTRIADKKPRNAEGIDAILFTCPNCESEFSIYATKNEIKCNKCTLKVKMDVYGLLEIIEADREKMTGITTPTEWNRWQYKLYEEKINIDFVYQENAVLYKVNPINGKKNQCGRGVITLSFTCFSYAGSYNDDSYDFSVANSTSSSFVHEAKTEIEIWVNGTLFAIAPENPKSVFKFIMLKNVIFNKMLTDADANRINEKD